MTAASRPTSTTDFAAAFGAVMTRAAAAAAPQTILSITATTAVVDFLEACASAIALAFDSPETAELLPGIDVDEPGAMLCAYLLLLAGEQRMADGELDADVVADWHARVRPAVWQGLGFARPPALLVVQLAFSLIAEREHQAAEVRALIWLVGELAAAGLLAGVRA